MNLKIVLSIIEILIGVLIAGIGFIFIFALFTGSWIGGVGPFLMVGGYLLAKDGHRTYKLLHK